MKNIIIYPDKNKNASGGFHCEIQGVITKGKCKEQCYRCEALSKNPAQ